MTFPFDSLRAASRLAAIGVATAVLFGSAAAPAGEVPVFLGAIGAAQAKPEVQSELRALLRAEISSGDFARIKSKERYMLSATLVQLDSVQSRDSVRATCVVSLALLRDNGSTLYAVIHGRATAEDARAHVDIAQRDAMRAAVHSAMVRVPKTLR